MVRQPTVLVADDDWAILALLQQVFTLDGYAVLTSTGGWDALERAPVQQPDVIVLDLQLPDLNGIDVSWRLRTDPRTAAIPIVVLSADDRAYRTASLLPVDERVCKPFDLACLSQAVGRWAHHRPALPSHPSRQTRRSLRRPVRDHRGRTDADDAE